MKKIKLTQGKYALVDDQDHERVVKKKWHWNSTPSKPSGYAIGFENGKAIKMHRFILGVRRDVHVDHRDGDGLNNQRENLRIATRHQNGANRRKQMSPTLSKFKGVTKPKSGKQWRAQINYKQDIRYIGGFPQEDHAALAYDMWAMALFGEYAKPNFKVVSYK